MDIKSIILGIAMSLGIFAVKTGIGQYYCIAKTANRWKVIGLLLTLNFAYLAVFLLSFILIININFLEYFNEMQLFFKSGMTIHIVMAFFLFYFGWKMIIWERQAPAWQDKTNYSILLLIIPCPVCSTAIFLTTAFMINIFPDKILYSFGICWGVFFAITMITLIILSLRKSQKNINSSIGELMMLISLYFFFNIAVAPNFKDMERIFRIAKYDGDKISTNENYLWAYAIIAFAFFAGFIYNKLKYKRSPIWIF